MKKIGLLGGMSWESSALYYRLLNEGIRDRLGGLHSAVCVMASVDFAAIERMQVAGDWSGAGDLLAAEALGLVAAGAECVVLCTNTMHRVAEQIQSAVEVPVLHLVDVTANAIRAQRLEKVGVLGTRFTMEEAFYRDRMRTNGVETSVPDADDRRLINEVIYHELVIGVVRDESRAEFRRIIQALADAGAQGVVLGCTEIELLVHQSDSPIPLFASTALHAQAAVDFALAD
ncbi:MAG TPA: aspartate/glutamate racemase family protein [Kineosporiaceae bacterium]